MKIQRRVFFTAIILSLLTACNEPEFTGVDGQSFDWQDFEGQWLVVNFWAEWCAPCREEIPELNHLHSETGQQVLGVNFDRPELAELQRQIKALDVQFPVVFSETKHRMKQLTPQVLPTTYVFDQQGQLLKTLVGPQTRQSILAAME